MSVTCASLQVFPLTSSLMTFHSLRWTHCCPGSSKVLTVQVVNVHLLQFVHLGYCWSPFRLFIALKLSWAYSEFWWFALSFWKTLLCKSMQSSLFLRNATRVCFVCPEQHLKAFHSRHEMSCCCCFYFCCDSGVVTLAVFKMEDLNFNT